MNESLTPNPIQPHRWILYSGSLLVRMTVAVALWQVIHSSNRLQRAVSAGVLNVISGMASLLGYFVRKSSCSAPRSPSAFIFTEVADFFAKDATDVLQRHHT